jgi:hypothetical protein
LFVNVKKRRDLDARGVWKLAFEYCANAKISIAVPAFDKPALVQLADNTVVPDFFDLNDADVGTITSGERLPAFGDGVGTLLRILRI